MKMFRLSNLALIVLCTLGFASAAHAQATRTWVSGVGDDANPCSRTAPCKTFAGAISKTAAGGEIDALDDAGFGAITITKSITINGGGHMASILAAGTNGVNVTAGTGDTVTLINLFINGVGTGLVGVSINSAKAVHIEGCQIYGFRAGTARAINDNRSGSFTTPPQLFVNDTAVRDNGSGIGLVGTAPQVIRGFIRNCRVENNTVFGILGSNSANVTVQSSIISGNGDAFKVDTNATGVVTGCVLNNNTNGIVASGNAVFMADDTVVNNSSGVTGTIITFGNNNVRNNISNNSLPATVGQQ